jgi:hypothetical protein
MGAASPATGLVRSRYLHGVGKNAMSTMAGYEERDMDFGSFRQQFLLEQFSCRPVLQASSDLLWSVSHPGGSLLSREGYLLFRYCILSSILTQNVSEEGLRLAGSTYSCFWLSIVPGNIMPWAKSYFSEYNLCLSSHCSYGSLGGEYLMYWRTYDFPNRTTSRRHIPSSNSLWAYITAGSKTTGWSVARFVAEFSSQRSPCIKLGFNFRPSACNGPRICGVATSLNV